MRRADGERLATLVQDLVGIAGERLDDPLLVSAALVAFFEEEDGSVRTITATWPERDL